MPQTRIDEIEKRIEIKRKKMGQLAETLGYTHPETIQASQELDQLIVERMKMK